MTNKFELYRCNVCGNVIEILISGDGHPVCCGEEMEKLEVKNDMQNSGMLTEKHSPKIETDEEGRTVVTVSNHPMDKEHYIMFVQAVSKDKNEIKTKFFYPSESVKMKACFNPNEMSARSYCNIHGVYVNE